MARNVTKRKMQCYLETLNGFIMSISSLFCYHNVKMVNVLCNKSTNIVLILIDNLVQISSESAFIIWCTVFFVSCGTKPMSANMSSVITG